MMERDQWSSDCTAAKPEGPKEAVTQSHGFTLFVCVLVCKEKERDCVRVSHMLHI